MLYNQPGWQYSGILAGGELTIFKCLMCVRIGVRFFHIFTDYNVNVDIAMLPFGVL